MNPSTLDLSRVQFAFTVSFHIIFPAFSIGLASFLAVLEFAWLRTGKPHYRSLCEYWARIFAVGFAMGVVSGVVMAYEFGTNWSGFTRFAGPVTGPLLAYEVMTAFFLEAGFLGVMLFGWNRVGPRAHFAATVLVAVGTLISTFWILASNSWMQTPRGIRIEGGHVVPVDWWAIIFNPSFPYRLAHMTVAAFLTGALVVIAAGAWHLLRGNRSAEVKTMYSMALWLLLVLAPVQAIVGDQHGLNTRRYQPAKIAAIEGLWETEKGGTSLNLIGFPDMAAQVTRYAVRVPHLGSLILTHSWDGQIQGLKDFPKEDRPNSSIIFWTFRVMVGLGLLMIATAMASMLLRARGELFEARWFHRLTLCMGPTGFISLLAGWITTEAGRQPWVVYGLLRTADAVAPVSVESAGVSLLVLIMVYCLVFGTGIYYILRLIGTNPASGTAKTSALPAQDALESGRRPLSVIR